MNTKKKKILLALGFGSLTAGILGYLGYRFFKSKKSTAPSVDPNLIASSSSIPTTTTVVSSSGSNSGVVSNSSFPLKLGSKGTLVKRLQNALIKKFGSGVLPKFGADGDFGSETFNALKSKDLPTVVTLSTIELLEKGNVIDPVSLSSRLRSAAIYKNLSQVLFSLSAMNSTDDYIKVSNEFKKTPNPWSS